VQNPRKLITFYPKLPEFLHLAISEVTGPPVISNTPPFKPLTPELNPSAQRCLTRFLLGILLLEPCISLMHA
jgi:hypothetical protein